MLAVDDEPRVREQLTERPQKSSPTGRMAAYHSDIELMERSQAFLEVMKQADRVSNITLPVLLIGESETVRVLVASAIHQRSGRSEQPFVAVNCRAIPADSMAAELFGRVIDREARGLWETAGDGTIFLDEITAIDLPLQEKLLHALQTGEIRRVGSGQTQRVNVRVLAGGNPNIEREVETGVFRRDLFHRLNGVTMVLPKQGAESEKSEPPPEDWVTLSEIEGRYVARVLEHTRGNKQAAARLLSVDRKTLDRMIKRHHIIPQHTRKQRAKVTGSAVSS